MAKLTADFKEYLYERLQEPDAAAEYLNAALEHHDVCTFLLALRYVTESRGIAKVASIADLNRESLYRMLSDQGNPRLSSMLAVLDAIGVEIRLKPISSEKLERQRREQVQPRLTAVQPRIVGHISDNEHDNENDTATRHPEPAVA